MAGLGAMDVDDMNINEAELNDIIPKNAAEVAELKKENGNQLYKIKQYRNALPFYTEAIELCPNTASYYGNRAACYMMMGKYADALEDARRAVTLEPMMVKGYVRIAKCGLALGDLAVAEQAVRRVRDLESDNKAIETEVRGLELLRQFEHEGTVAFAKGDYRKVVYCMDRCLAQSPTCVRYKLHKAECLTLLGRCQEAQDIANSVLHIDSGNADAIYVRGVCLFYQDNADKALSHFQQVLRLAPDHGKAMEAYKRCKHLRQKKEEGNEAFKTGRYQDAYTLYTEALAIDPLNIKTNAKLHFNKAIVCNHLGKQEEAVQCCSDALRLDEDYLKALLLRAKCYTQVGQHEEAVQDYERVVRMDKSREHKKLLQEAKLALKKSKRKDYYKILGVDKAATDDDIKKAYRKRALVHHPDRHASASEQERKEQERKFKELGEAYGVLSDPKKKARYDSGQDMEDFDGGMPDIDPTQVFQAFFNSGPTQEFSFTSGGFPSGFTFQFG